MGLGVVWDALSLQMEYIGMDERLSVGELPDSTTTNTAEADPDAAAAEEEEAAFNALNPLVNLKKQYDELVTLGQVAQLKVKRREEKC